MEACSPARSRSRVLRRACGQTANGLQLPEDFDHRCRARRSLFGQAAVEQPLQHGQRTARKAGRGGRQRRDRVAQHGGERVGPRAAVERPPARQQLVEKQPEAEHVRTCIHRRTARLLRRHVRRRSHHVPRTRRQVRRCLSRPRLQQFRHAEVDQPRVALGVDQHVRRLEVPRHDPLRVRAGHPSPTSTASASASLVGTGPDRSRAVSGAPATSSIAR